MSVDRVYGISMQWQYYIAVTKNDKSTLCTEMEGAARCILK